MSKYWKDPIVDPLGIGPCGHCAGTGWVDYPTNKKPCPVHGHLVVADKMNEIKDGDTSDLDSHSN